jgi:hypothetical protein
VKVEVGVEAEEEIEIGEEEVDIPVEVKVLKMGWKQREGPCKLNDSIGQDMIPPILVVGIEGGQEGKK